MNEIKIRQHPEDPNQYVVTSPEINIWDDLIYHFTAKEYNYAYGKWIQYQSSDTVTNSWDGDTFNIYKGFSIYLLNKFREYLDEESIKLLEHDTYAEPMDFNHEGLYDYQKEWLTEILKYRRGIIQTPTGKGKTECIARLILSALDNGITILVTTGISKVIDEIKLRLWEYRPELELPNYWDSSAQINIIYPNGFARSYQYNFEDPFWSKVSMVISDEVDCSTSESAWSCYIPVSNPECRWYGFSATAEKLNADRLDIRENLKCIHTESTIYVISFFGMSWVFDKPRNYDIDIIEVPNIGLRAISVELNENVDSETNVYNQIVNYVFSHEEYLRTIDYILGRYKKLFIPINNLTYIDNIYNVFGDKYKVASISGEGYYHNKEGMIDLDKLKYLMEENQIDILLSSASGFKGLDFRGMPNVLLTLGNQAGIVLQYLGRITRQKHFRIFTITAGGNWKIPIITNTNINQLKLICSYYEDCNIRFLEDKYE